MQSHPGTENPSPISSDWGWMLAQSMGAETLGLRSRRALSFTARHRFTQANLEIQTSNSLNPLARGRVNLIRPRVGQFESTGGRVSDDVRLRTNRIVLAGFILAHSTQV